MKNYLQLNLVFLGVLLNSSLLCDLKAQSPGPQPDPSLKLHFDFDENFSNGKVLDVTGNGHDGWSMNIYPTNTPLHTNWITSTNGIFGTYAGQWKLDGNIFEPPSTSIPVSTYLAVTNTTGINVLTNGTLSFWAWPSSSSGYYTYLFDAGYPSYPFTGGFDIQLVNIGSQRLWLNIYDGTQTGAAWPAETADGWHHYGLTWDGTNNTMTLYHEGLPCSTNSLSTDAIRIDSPTNWLCIGAFKASRGQTWDPSPTNGYWFAGFYEGRMDDIRIYDRTLSAAEVQALYQGSTYAQNLAIHKAASQSVQVRWDANSNAVYQVEYRSNLTGTAWSPLQSAIPGSVTNSIIDSILGQPARFYRVRVLP